MVVVKVFPVVTFLMSMRQRSVDCSAIVTVTVSPAFTASVTVRVDWGGVSVHAS